MYNKTFISRKFASNDLWMWWLISILLWGIYFLLHIYIEIPIIKKHHENEPPLYDVGHIDISEKTQELLGRINDWLVISIIAISVLLIALGSHAILPALGYVAFFTALIYILKTLTAVATILPDSSGRCRNGRLLGSCNELFFSGHFAITLTMFVLLARTLPAHKMHIVAAGCLICPFVALFAVMSRNHYTIDVIGAILIVSFLKQYI